jgi:hypothetical protein
MEGGDCMKGLINILMMFALTFSALVVTSPSVAEAACAPDAYVNENGEWVGDTKENCEAVSDELSGKILRFVKIISTLVVVFAVGMIIYGGFKYITSQGEPKQTESAKQQIWYSAMGLFIVLTAFTILQLFINATG